MKKLMLAVVMLPLCSMMRAQTLVDSALRFNITSIPYNTAQAAKTAQLQAADPADTTEGGDVHEFIRQSAYRQQNISPAAPADSDMFAPYLSAMRRIMITPNTYCAGSAGGQWQCVGPFTNAYGGSENQGRVNCVWISPNDTNHIIAGTYGGVWESKNGGHSWQNISDNIGTGSGSILIPGTMGISSLDVDPLDSNIINVILSDWGGVMMGAAYTTNAGTTWQEDTAYNRIVGITVFSGYQQQKMMYLPGQELLFSYYGSKVLMKSSPTSAWTDITPSMGVDNMITDMEYSTFTEANVIISTNAADYIGHLWNYDLSSLTWSNLNITMPSSSDTITKIDDISLSATDSVFMLVEVKGENQHLVSTPLNTLNMTILDSNLRGHETFQYLLVSPNNTNVFYFSLHNGGSNFFQSTNRCASFPSSIQGSTHPDGRYFTIYQPATSLGGVHDDVLFGCSDGGVVKKRYGQTDFQSITGDSLCITNFFSMSNPEGDEDDIMIGGAQDNGGLTYNKKTGQYPGRVPQEAITSLPNLCAMGCAQLSLNYGVLMTCNELISGQQQKPQLRWTQLVILLMCRKMTTGPGMWTITTLLMWGLMRYGSGQ